jgi:hypothetical protein
MNARALAASAALLLFAPALGATPAQAQSIGIPGFRSSGTIVVQMNLQGQPLNVGGRVAMYHKGSMYRLDLISLGIPGLSGDLSAVAATLIGPGGASVLYDGATGALSAWSDANKTYYTEAPRSAPSAPAPTAASAAPASSDPLAALASVGALLRDVQNASIQLTGHGMVNGHPSTSLDVQMKRQRPGKPLENYHAQLALADDLNEFPLQITLQSVPATKNDFGGTMKLDLTDVQRDTPADSIFAVPQGYTRVSSISGVLHR